MKKHLLLSVLSFIFIFASCDVMHFEPDCPYNQQASEQNDGTNDAKIDNPNSENSRSNGSATLGIYVRGTYELTLDYATIDGKTVLTSTHIDGTPLFVDNYNGTQTSVRFVYTVGTKQRTLELPLSDYINAIGKADGILVDLYFRETQTFNF